MRLIIGLSIAFFAVLTLASIFLLAGDIGDLRFAAIGVLGILAVMLISGSLTAYFWYLRGKVYEERGQSGPDD